LQTLETAWRLQIASFEIWSLLVYHDVCFILFPIRRRRSMQVLLIKNVDGLGRTGDIKEVAGGYAHNFLFTRKLAVPVTDGAIKQAEITKEADKRRKERKVHEAKTLASMMDGKTVVFHARAGEGDRLYGSITNADIADKLGHAIGQEVDRRFIEIEHPIKTLGEHRVTVKTGPGAAATVFVRVERSGEA
jgi:large subunit ribosomal protein L9